jgi:hypothetical protein
MRRLLLAKSEGVKSGVKSVDRTICPTWVNTRSVASAINPSFALQWLVSVTILSNEVIQGL